MAIDQDAGAGPLPVGPLPVGPLSVGQLASRAGVRVDTVRYYERTGLLPRPRRTGGDHRRYGPTDVDRLLFIRGARRLGLRLAEIRALTEIRDTGTCPCGPAQALLREHVGEIDREITRLTALRAELTGPVDDEGFEARFLDWYQRASDHRVSWLAAVGGDMVGMMNLAVFERMPQPGRDAGTWGYLANAFVLAAYRNHGIGSLLLRALLAHADDHGYLRVVLRPSQRAVPFYQRAGFAFDTGLLVRYYQR
jgi:DNA-binding transcriptional MerR regulator